MGAEEGIWNTEEEPKQTCITMGLKIFTLRQQYCEDDQTREGGMDGSIQLALMTGSINSWCGKTSKYRANCRTYA